MNMQPCNDNAHNSSSEPCSHAIGYGERLLQRLTTFGHLLWEVGINIGPHQLQDLAEMLNFY